MSRNSCSFNSYNNSNPYIVVGCEAVTMNNRRNEQLKHKAEYEKEYQKRPEIKERMKEYMRLYRARKKKEWLDAGDIVGTSVNNNDSTLIQKKIYTEIKTPALKTTNIGMDSQNDHQYELHQTPTVSIPQTSNILI